MITYLKQERFRTMYKLERVKELHNKARISKKVADTMKIMMFAKVRVEHPP